MSNNETSTGWLLASVFLALNLESAVARPKAAELEKGPAGSGVAVEFSLQPAARKEASAAGVFAGEDALVRFKLTDIATHAPLKGLHPAAWVDLAIPRSGRQKDAGPSDCKGRIRTLLQEGLGSRPAIDLNAYYILALNDQPSISVIDPLRGVGSSKLITRVPLKSPGDDWVLSGDQKKLYITLPADNEVAVVDTSTWKVTGYIPVGIQPARLALQPDEKYLWVANDGPAGGVSVIDAQTHKVAATIPTGAGRHELAFTEDSRYAFASNEQEGTVSVLDVQRLIRLNSIKTGARPVSLAFSPLSQMLYVAHAEGAIVALDARKQEASARIATPPGLKVIRVSRDGRWGFAANGQDDKVYILDASTHRVAKTVEVSAQPEQLSFTANYAYVRSRGSPEISMIPLDALAKGEALSVAHFPGGQAAPEKSSHPALADAVAPAPEGGAVLVANPVDKTIYYYSEGMAAPMGNFQNYGSEPRAVRIVDRSLRETAPGVYSANVRLPQEGPYDVALFVDNPRFHQCFPAKAAPNPERSKQSFAPLRIEFLLKEKTIRAQEPTRLRFRLTGLEDNRAMDQLKDVQVIYLLSPGIWHRRELARPVGGGIYEAELTAPRPGIYYVHLRFPSLGVKFGQLPYLILQAIGGARPAAPEPWSRP